MCLEVTRKLKMRVCSASYNGEGAYYGCSWCDIGAPSDHCCFFCNTNAACMPYKA